MRSPMIFALGLLGALAFACGDDDFVPAGEAGSAGAAGSDSQAAGGTAGEGGAAAFPSGPFGDPAHTKLWAVSASAVGVYMLIYEPLAFDDGELTFADTACPATTFADNLLTIAGEGCVDALGELWLGSVSIEHDDDGGRRLRLDGYGHHSDPELLSTVSGTAVVAEPDEGTRSFVLDLTHEGGVTTSIDYEGSVEGSYDGPTLWNGTGRIGRQGPVEPTGVIAATTVAEAFDQAICSGQPISGSTTLEAEDQQAVITYDGASDCDGVANARWSVDGEDRGTLEGVTCSVAHAGRPTRAPAGTLALLALLGAALACRKNRQKAGRLRERRL